jgi:hypothetical protein
VAHDVNIFGRDHFLIGVGQIVQVVFHGQNYTV